MSYTVSWQAAWLLLGQDGGGGAAPAAGEQGTFLQRLLANPMTLIVGLFVIMYLTVMAPERRRKAREEAKRASLQKNDRVVTIGGIHGTVVSAAPDSDVITLRIDENGNTRIKVNRSAIATKIEPDESNKSKESDS